MQKDTRPAPIVFNLNNADDLSTYVGTAFSWVNFLFYEEEASIHRFIKEIDCFTKEQFLLLHARISNKRNKNIPMNETHFIILYAIISYCGKMILCKKDVAFILDDAEPEVEKNLKTFTQPFVDFSNKNLKALQHNYKNNHHLAAAMAKINTFQIPASV